MWRDGWWRIPLIRVRVGNKVSSGGYVNLKTMINSAPGVPKNTLKSMKVLLSRAMYMKTYMLDCKCNFWSSKGQILKSTSKTVI